MFQIFAALGGVEKLIRIVAIIVGLVLAYFLIKKIVNMIKRRNAGFQSVDISRLDKNKNYDSFALAVHSAFDAWGFNDADSMDDCAAALLPLNNDELKEVNNRYISLYGNGKRTLYAALNDYYFCFPCSNLTSLIARVKSLGIL